jgi:Bacterial PH domain
MTSKPADTDGMGREGLGGEGLGSEGLGSEDGVAADGTGEDQPAPVLLQVRPRRITIFASIAAFVVVAVMVVVGLLLRDTNEGVEFRVSDQIGLIGIGLVMGGVIMTAARPRLRVDRNGLWIRNILGNEFTPWPLVLRVSYPQGAPWAQILMPDDETKPLMAIQAMDRGRAVRALEQVRELQARYGPPAPAPKTPPVLTPEMDEQRPLGRLEIIDRQKAAARDRDLRYKEHKRSRNAARGGTTG